MDDIEYTGIYFLQPVISGRVFASKLEFDMRREGEYFRLERISGQRLVVYVPVSNCILADDRMLDVAPAPQAKQPKVQAKKQKTEKEAAPKEAPRVYVMPVGVPTSRPIGRYKADTDPNAKAPVDPDIAARVKSVLPEHNAK